MYNIMKKISISNVVEFQRKSPKSQLNFLINILKTKSKSEQELDKGGGNYWVHSLSTISKTFINDDKELIKDKLNILNDKLESATAKISKNMYQRNIEILHNFEDFSFSDFKPKFELQYLLKSKDKSILTIKGIPIQVLPHHVFTYEENKIKKIGAIWFVSKLEGYKTSELGIFAEALYKYLKLNYSNNYQVLSKFCISVDVINLNNVSYDKIENNEIPSILNSTLESIREILK